MKMCLMWRVYTKRDVGKLKPLFQDRSTIKNLKITEYSVVFRKAFIFLICENQCLVLLWDTSIQNKRFYVTSPSFCRVHINKNTERTIPPKALNIQ